MNWPIPFEIALTLEWHVVYGWMCAVFSYEAITDYNKQEKD